MSEYGLYVNPKDGGKQIVMTEDSYPINFIRDISMTMRYGNMQQKLKTVNIPGMSNYDTVIVPSSLCTYTQNGAINRNRIQSYWTEGDNFKCQYDYYAGPSDAFILGSEYDSKFFIFGTLKNTPQNEYGLFFGNGIDNFRGVSQSSNVYHCVFRQKVRLSDRQYWSLPDSVPNKNRALVFVRPESPGHILQYNRDKGRIDSKGAGDVYIVIFTNGLTLNENTGLNIWNKSGELIFNSEFPPFTKNGHSIAIDKSVGSSSFAKPMFTIDNPGAWLTRRSDYAIIWQTGFRIEGNRIIGINMWDINQAFIYNDYFNDEFANVIYGGSYAIDFNDYF